MPGTQEESILNLPNLFSFARIAMIPVFGFFLFQGRARAAFFIFLFAAFTDLLDGIAARKLGQQTRLGALLDPAADKLLMSAAVIFLGFPTSPGPNFIPFWLIIVIIGRDLIIVLGALILFRKIGRKAFPPKSLGKISTFFQMTVLVLVLLLNAANQYSPVLLWLYLMTGILTLISGAQYIATGITWMKPESEEKDRLQT